jgi:hypothetical protein
MVYEYLVTENKAVFLQKVKEIAAKLGVNPDWLMIVFKIESGINHRAVNAVTGATGLIQFMPATAAGLGTSTVALRNMGNVEQLDYVYKYFKPYAGRLSSLTDLYTVTFFPRALGQPDSYVLQTDTLKAGTIARQNPGFDLDKDGQITYGEFKAAVLSKVPSEVIEYVKKK